MGCCLLAALLVSVARRAWFAVTGREPAPAPFPPAARRPAPGSPVAPEPVHAAAPAAPWTVLAPASAAATAVLAYVATTAALGAVGIVQTADRPLVGGLARDLTLATALGALLLVAVRARPTRRPRREHRGRCLVAAGLTWTVVLVVDVHLLGHGHAATLVADVALHAAGLLALYAGLLLWQPLGPARRRPAHDRTTRPEGARA